MATVKKRLVGQDVRLVVEIDCREDAIERRDDFRALELVLGGFQGAGGNVYHVLEFGFLVFHDAGADG